MKRVDFEYQLDKFEELNFFSNRNLAKEELIKMGCGVDEYEQNPYWLMYVSLGSEDFNQPRKPISDKCWFTDSECIDGQGVYKNILLNLIRITRGEIVLTEIDDFIDFEKGIAGVSFKYFDYRIKWNFRVENDWMDTRILDYMVDLSNEKKTKGKYSYYNTGQTFVIGYCDPEEFKKIKSLVGNGLTWLNRKIHPWLEF